MSEFEDVLYEAKGGTAWITINRPEVLNALRTKTYADLRDAFKKGTADPEIGVMVLTGAGDHAFSSGGDVKAQSSRTVHVGREHLRVVTELGAAMRNSGKPIIAAVNGYSIGGGNELNIMCDLTIASDRAKFGQVGPRVGSVPVWGAVQMLPRMVGEKKAREIVYLCEQYTAEEAVAMGLANKVVPHDELYSEVEKWCEIILDKSPRALRIAKILMNHGSDLEYNTFISGTEMLSMTYGDDENLEGVHAFLEKRPPNYRKFRTA
ncbi:MAG: 1,4-dihydroxy-6-naphthoate synthase [Streptosporangiales bacterium]|nr:1,4-dihydroxy-6-naphthoate synthase [Streptosporangiales bacterium]